jgi:AcrR family transcriptional regulator
MIELSARAGYAEVSVARLCAHAGVSTASFYECFKDREDCLLAARDAAAQRILGRVAPASAPGSEDALRVALDGLLRALARDPDAGRVLLIEALAGGARVQARRRRALADCERRAEALLDGSRGPTTFDIPAPALIGALRGVAAQRLRAAEQEQLPSLLDDLLAWIGSYAIPDGASRSSVDSALLVAPDPSRPGTQTADACAIGVPSLPRGRHTMPPALAARIQRKRIIHGTAQATSATGYAEVSVTEILAASHVSRQIFYEQFPNEQQAFVAAQQHATVDLLAMCWEAYFAAESWPERVWSVLDALTSLIAANPALTHLRIVDCYAAGPAAVQWTEELVSAAAIFLKQGYRSCPGARALPPLASQAIASALFELIQRQVADGRASTLPLRLPLLTYLAIAPFIGPLDALALVRQFGAQASLSAADASGR